MATMGSAVAQAAETGGDVRPQKSRPRTPNQSAALWELLVGLRDTLRSVFRCAKRQPPGAVVMHGVHDLQAHDFGYEFCCVHSV